MNLAYRFLRFVLALVIATSLIRQETKSQTREPKSPKDDEVAAHLVGEVPVIRMDLNKFPELQSAGTLPVELLVDEQGNVISAKLEGADSPDIEELTKPQREMLKAVVAEAEKTGMKLHFRPFEEDGHPVEAQFEIELPLRPLDEQPAKEVPFPQIKKWNLVKIVLSRTGCFGTCPSYDVEVHGDGTVLYDGGLFVAITGSHRASVPGDAVFQMVEAFRAADYFL